VAESFLFKERLLKFNPNERVMNESYAEFLCGAVILKGFLLITNQRMIFIVQRSGPYGIYSSMDVPLESIYNVYSSGDYLNVESSRGLLSFRVANPQGLSALINNLLLNWVWFSRI